jgi:hypothetical protein
MALWDQQMLCCSSGFIRQIKSKTRLFHVARVSEKRNVNGVACSKANTRRPSCGWESDAKLGVKEIEWDSGLDGFGWG